MNRLFLVCFATVLLSTNLSKCDSNLEEQNIIQEEHLDPINDSDTESSPKEQGKRTVFKSESPHGWAKHVGIHPLGYRYTLGYGPVDLKHVAVPRPIRVRLRGYHYPRPIIPFHHGPRPLTPVKDGWRPIIPQPLPRPQLVKPFAPVVPLHIPPPPRPISFVPIQSGPQLNVVVPQFIKPVVAPAVPTVQWNSAPTLPIKPIAVVPSPKPVIPVLPESPSPPIFQVVHSHFPESTIQLPSPNVIHENPGYPQHIHPSAPGIVVSHNPHNIIPAASPLIPRPAPVLPTAPLIPHLKHTHIHPAGTSVEYHGTRHFIPINGQIPLPLAKFPYLPHQAFNVVQPHLHGLIPQPAIVPQPTPQPILPYAPHPLTPQEPNLIPFNAFDAKDPHELQGFPHLHHLHPEVLHNGSPSQQEPHEQHDVQTPLIPGNHPSFVHQTPEIQYNFDNQHTHIDQNPHHFIQPGHTDVQIPSYLPEHPNYDGTHYSHEGEYPDNTQTENSFRPSLTLEPPYTQSRYKRNHNSTEDSKKT